jgi:hypothetical protein
MAEREEAPTLENIDRMRAARSLAVRTPASSGRSGRLDAFR